MVHVGAAELSTFDLWHQRLGNPSERVVKILPAIRSSHNRKKLNKICDACAMAKRHVIVFLVVLIKPISCLN